MKFRLSLFCCSGSNEGRTALAQTNGNTIFLDDLHFCAIDAHYPKTIPTMPFRWSTEFELHMAFRTFFDAFAVFKLRRR